MHGTIDVMVRRSSVLAVLLVLVHVASLALIWSLALPIALHIGLKLAVLSSLLWSLFKAGWIVTSNRSFRLRLTPAGRQDAPDRIEITYASGEVMRGSVVEGSLVLARLVILRCRRDRDRWWQPDRGWLLLPDSIPADDFRRLRVRLRWGRAAPV